MWLTQKSDFLVVQAKRKTTAGSLQFYLKKLPLQVFTYLQISQIDFLSNFLLMRKWFYAQGLKIWVNWICATSILIFPVFHVFKSRFWVSKTLQNMNLKLKGFWRCTLWFLWSALEVQKELLTSFLRSSCFKRFFKVLQKTPLQEPRFKSGSVIDLLQ